jgi:hypothetical protein
MGGKLRPWTHCNASGFLWWLGWFWVQSGRAMRRHYTYLSCVQDWLRFGMANVRNNECILVVVGTDSQCAPLREVVGIREKPTNPKNGQYCRTHTHFVGAAFCRQFHNRKSHPLPRTLDTHRKTRTHAPNTHHCRRGAHCASVPTTDKRNNYWKRTLRATNFGQ